VSQNVFYFFDDFCQTNYLKNYLTYLRQIFRVGRTMGVRCTPVVLPTLKTVQVTISTVAIPTITIPTAAIPTIYRLASMQQFPLMDAAVFA